MYYDLNGTDVIPNVAKDWDISDDGLTYTLYLREGMKWSDGVAFTSEDFVWHFENVILDDELNPTRDGQIGWSGVQAESFAAIDDYTVAVTLRERKDGFLDSLANYTTGGWTLHGRIADGMYGPTHYLKTIHRKFADDKGRVRQARGRRRLRELDYLLQGQRQPTQEHGHPRNLPLEDDQPDHG